VIVVNGQLADSATTATVPFSNAADGALTILLIEKCLILLAGLPLPAHLRVVVRNGKAFTATVGTKEEPRKLLAGLFLFTPVTNYRVAMKTLVFDNV
jgi:hypothetical protein